jgi:hypothetical protein
MSAVIWTATASLQWMTRQTPAGVVLPPGTREMALQQFWTPSDGSPGEWRDVPIRHWMSTQSPNLTVVATVGVPIIDAAGNQWEISASRSVSINGGPTDYSANVIELVYVNGAVWQQAGTVAPYGWWSKANPTAPWVPQPKSPLP